MAQPLRRQLGSFLPKETCDTVAQFFGTYPNELTIKQETSVHIEPTAFFIPIRNCEQLRVEMQLCVAYVLSVAWSVIPTTVNKHLWAQENDKHPHQVNGKILVHPDNGMLLWKKKKSLEP